MKLEPEKEIKTIYRVLLMKADNVQAAVMFCD